MGLGLFEYFTKMRHPHLRWWCVFFVWAWVMLPLAAQAVEFSVKSISDPLIPINRDPVISETGLAAWMYHRTNAASHFSHIGVYHRDQRIDLTEPADKLMFAATKPSVQSNRLVFLANQVKYVAEDATWTLKEVDVRDEGDIVELPALYRASEDDGYQTLTPLFGEKVAEEDVVVESVGLSTNVARRHPSGLTEVWMWVAGDNDFVRVTHDERNDFAPSFWGEDIAWQKAKGWPFGWEIMALVGGNRMQLTTNYYYEMAPKVQGNHIVWYGWDGFDYEIFLMDTTANEITQITSNRYDDVAPVVWDGAVVWEGYSGLEADIFLWKSGETKKISSNIDDDLYPRIWGNKVVWQGFDGDDYEIYLYDLDKGGVPTKITSNNYDDTNPEIRDDLIVWMGYQDNWDSEIFYADLEGLNSLSDVKVVQLTDREEDDRDPKTAGRRIVWVSEENGNTRIMLAEPR